MMAEYAGEQNASASKSVAIRSSPLLLARSAYIIYFRCAISSPRTVPYSDAEPFYPELCFRGGIRPAEGGLRPVPGEGEISALRPCPCAEPFTARIADHTHRTRTRKPENPLRYLFNRFSLHYFSSSIISFPNKSDMETTFAGDIMHPRHPSAPRNIPRQESEPLPGIDFRRHDTEKEPGKPDSSARDEISDPRPGTF